MAGTGLPPKPAAKPGKKAVVPAPLPKPSPPSEEEVPPADAEEEEENEEYEGEEGRESDVEEWDALTQPSQHGQGQVRRRYHITLRKQNTHAEISTTGTVMVRDSGTLYFLTDAGRQAPWPVKTPWALRAIRDIADEDATGYDEFVDPNIYDPAQWAPYLSQGAIGKAQLMAALQRKLEADGLLFPVRGTAKDAHDTLKAFVGAMPRAVPPNFIPAAKAAVTTLRMMAANSKGLKTDMIRADMQAKILARDIFAQAEAKAQRYSNRRGRGGFPKGGRGGRETAKEPSTQGGLPRSEPVPCRRCGIPVQNTRAGWSEHNTACQ